MSISLSTSLKIEHLEYENALLSKRNVLLAQQNQKLLTALAAKQSEINEYEQSKYKTSNYPSKDLINLLDKQISKCMQTMKGSAQLDNIRQKLSKYRQNANNSNKQNQNTYNQSASSLSVHSLFELISQLISSLSCKIANMDTSKSKLQKIQQRLKIRRTANIKTERIVHMIKQPSEQLSNLNYKFYEQDMGYLRQLYEKIIRAVKKPSINIRNLDNIYDKITQLMKTRWTAKIDQGKLSVLQRKFQLGQMNSLQISFFQQQLLKSKQSLKNIKSSIQNAILILQ